MTERLEDVWISRDYPVLREVTLRIDAGDRPTLDEVRAALGFDTVTMVRATRALDRRHLVDGVRTAEHGIVRFTDVSGQAYLFTGLHPDADDALSGLVQLLQQAADQTTDEEERSRIRRAADGLRGVSRDVMVGVMTAFAARYGVH